MKLALSLALVVIFFSLSILAQSGEEMKTHSIRLLATDSNGIPQVGRLDQFSLSYKGKAVEKKFVEDSRPLALSILVDNSGSMRPLLKTIQKGINAGVTNLGEGDQAQIIRFVSSASISLEVQMTGDKKKLVKGSNELFIEGGATALIDASYLAIQQLQELDRSKWRKKILLISDGDERDSAYEMMDVFLVSEREAIPIYFVSLSNALLQFEKKNGSRKLRDFKKVLQQNISGLVRASRGVAFFPKSDQGFVDTVAQAVKVMRSPDVVSFSVPKDADPAEIRFGLSPKAKTDGTRLDLKLVHSK